MPALDPVLPENCDEYALRMEGLLWAFGLVYQISSSFGAIAIEQNELLVLDLFYDRMGAN